MVGWQEFVSLTFEVARDKGHVIDSLEDSQVVLSTASELWAEYDLKSASKRDAREVLRSEISRA